MKRFIFLLAFLIAPMIAPQTAFAFCGFYVAKADAELFNGASKVIMTRNDDRTVITMANDFQGDAKDFAIVIPVPNVITKQQVNVTENRIIDHLDAYTAPRLVEYFDDDPCRPQMEMMRMSMASAPMASAVMADGASSAQALGVTIEEQYTVGEYDILVLSAKQSDGLLTWLNQEGYKLPKGAKEILGSYIKQDMKFFVAKVNLEEHESSGFTYLRPLQVAYEDERFMLPIRLGTLNANGPQDLILMTLTKKGRVETSNYRTTKIPTDMDVPLYVKEEFGDFYKAMFAKQVEKEGMKTVFLEYAWDMAWCDPCAADPLPNDDLRTLGVWWLDQPDDRIKPMPGQPQPRMIMPPQGGAVDVFVTRLHVRYTADKFPEDLTMHETADRENFQGRYVLRHPWTKEANCEAGKQYFQSLPTRFEKEAQSLSNITGWDIADIREKMEDNGQDFKGKPIVDPRPWWGKMWGNDADDKGDKK